MPLKNKRIWLIGASEGIGAALAEALAGEGATLVLSARNAQKIEELCARLPGSGHQAYPLDVCSHAQMQQVWAALHENIPDIVIYNAGAYTPMDAQHFDLAAVEAMLDVNLRGALRLIDVVLPTMLSRSTGHLVIVGSVAGYRGLPSAMGYGASKAGLNHFAENLRADLKGTGITVQLVCPGFVKTRLTDKNDFRMPCMITPQQAARAIVNGLQSSRFEIHFPKRFTFIMKLLRLLPHRLYFRLV